ncbi:MAG TPA: hypothetical protein VF841_04830 [Anaeromyxobacter sp.]
MDPSPRALAAVAVLSVAACRPAPARIETEPSTLRFGLRGQTAKVRASPIARNGTPVPDNVCRWSSTDEKVATVSGPHNEATVTAAGPGSASVVCTIGDLRAEVPVQVRVVAKVTVKPDRADLKVTDEPQPFPLEVAAYDDSGAPVLGRIALSRCADESVCRGDGRGQLWGVAAGKTTAFVEVEGARSTEIPVTVVDARTAAGKPQRVTGNPMEAIEREVRKREAEAKKAAEKAGQ